MFDLIKYLTGHVLTRERTAAATEGWCFGDNGYRFFSGVLGDEIHIKNTHLIGPEASITAVSVYTLDGRLKKTATIWAFPEGTKTDCKEYNPPGSFFGKAA
jgi:hypothetical protein